MKALAKDREIYILYRAATKITGRDMTLLVLTNRGERSSERVLSRWSLASCPMSSAALVAPGLAAWELDQQVAVGFLKGFQTFSPRGTGRRKHPALAQSTSGIVLLAWVENSGWQKAGTLAWQLFKNWQPMGEIQRGDRLPVWSMPAAVAVKEDFYIIY